MIENKVKLKKWQSIIESDVKVILKVNNINLKIDTAFISNVGPADIKYKVSTGRLSRSLCKSCNPSTLDFGGKQDRQNQFFKPPQRPILAQTSQSNPSQ